MADVATNGAEGASSTAGSAAAGKVYTEAEVDELVSGLKRKNQELLGEKKSLAERTKAIPDGFDPAEFEALRKEKADRQREEAEKRGEWEKLRQSQAAQFEAQLKKEQDARTQLERELEAELIEGGASRILAGLNPVDKSLPMLLRYVRDNAAVVFAGLSGVPPTRVAQPRPCPALPMGLQVRPNGWPSLRRAERSLTEE